VWAGGCGFITVAAARAREDDEVMAFGAGTVAAPAFERSLHAPTLSRMVVAAGDRGTDVALEMLRDGSLVQMTYAELGNRADRLARGLLALGVRPGDRIGLLSSTRPEWVIADCAALAAGAVLVPIYHTNSPGECAYVLTHSGARAVVVEDGAQLEKIAAVRAERPELEHVISFEEAGEAISFGSLAQAGAHVPDSAVADARNQVVPGAVATIIYTSGTTGPPKGCVVTHANFLSAIEMYERSFDLGAAPVVFMFLPLAHSLARLVHLLILDVGGTMAFASGDRERLLEEIQTMRPTHFPAVPRVFEKIRVRALAQAEEKGRLASGALSAGLALARRVRATDASGSRPRIPLRIAHRLADRLVLAKVREVFGPDLRLALVGAAPMPRDVLEFFDACGVRIYEGYGMTETCAAATINTPESCRFGTVGRPLPGSDVAISEDGEVLMRGPHVFGGYYRDQAATDEAFDGEWLLSGDLGGVDPEGFLTITGRKKDLIITSSGKNISPSNLESALRESRWISQAVVHGDNRPYLVALLTLDPEEAPALAERVGVVPDLAAMAVHPAVHGAIANDVNAVNEQFARVEQIKRFAILDRDLTQEAGELTPTMKVKRALVIDRYRDRFEALYGGANGKST
jgi:long-chain acyl-CoA synthetase